MLSTTQHLSIKISLIAHQILNESPNPCISVAVYSIQWLFQNHPLLQRVGGRNIDYKVSAAWFLEEHDWAWQRQRKESQRGARKVTVEWWPKWIWTCQAPNFFWIYSGMMFQGSQPVWRFKQPKFWWWRGFNISCWCDNLSIIRTRLESMLSC